MTSQIIAMIIFSFTMSITPGPVNMINLSSGATHGIRKTIPFVSGSTIGFILLLTALAIGFMRIVLAYPLFLTYMAVGGTGFILYMSYKIAKSDPGQSTQAVTCPKFTEGVLLQWLNPKAWLACISGISLFADKDSFFPLFLFIALYFVVCYLCLFAWAVLGDRLKLILRNRTSLAIFNYLMGGLLSICALYLLYTSLTEVL